MRDVFIAGRGALSPAGADLEANWRALALGIPGIKPDPVFGVAGRLASDAETKLLELDRAPGLRHADRATRLGILAAREAWAEAGLPRSATAVVMGSSRGATATIEREHERFLETGRTGAHASPSSTAGTLATAVAQDLGLDGPTVAVSAACATGLTALGTGLALVQSGQAEQALVGGTEASLTPFTHAQLAAAAILAKTPSILYPARPMHPERSGMVPGEGAAALVLATGEALAEAGRMPLARVVGYGAATEPASPTGISAGGDVLVRAIRRALEAARLDPDDVDLVVGHGAGTVRGDAAELAAYARVFEARRPTFTFHKWLTGHMIGASGAHSAALAVSHLLTGEVPGLPYHVDGMEVGAPDLLRLDARRALVTVLGFGGAGAALILERTS